MYRSAPASVMGGHVCSEEVVLWRTGERADWRCRKTSGQRLKTLKDRGLGHVVSTQGRQEGRDRASSMECNCLTVK